MIGALPRSPEAAARYRGRLQFILVVLLLLYWLFAHYVERLDLAASPPEWWQNVTVALPLFQVVAQPVLTLVEFFFPRVLRHFVPVIVGWWLVNQAAIAVLRNLYDLPDNRIAMQVMRRIMSARSSGTAVVTAEALENAHQQGNLLSLGGPGQVVVRGGYAAVTEQNGRFRRVIGPGAHHLVAFERVVNVVDLRPQERVAERVRLSTRDGIELWTNLEITFRINTGEQAATKAQPFPFERDAVRLASYASIVSQRHESTWEELPLPLAIGRLQDTVAQLNLDDLIEPSTEDQDPHQTIRRQMGEMLQDSLHQYGIEVLSVRLGAFELIDPVTDRRIEYWQTRMEQARRLEAARSEADALSEVEMARAEAKADMIRAIAESLDQARREGGSEIGREIVALRLVEAMEQIARQSHVQLKQPADPRLLGQLEQLRSQVVAGSSDASQMPD